MVCSFLCKDCNSRFGSGFEAGARLASDVRKAVRNSDLENPLTIDTLEIGAEFVTDFAGLKATQRLSKDKTMSPVELPDGSIVLPDALAVEAIATKLRRIGHGQAFIEEAIESWSNLPEDSEMPISDSLRLKRWSNHPSYATYREPVLSHLVPLKIAYETTALIVGSAIFDKAFDPIRNALLEQDESIASALIEKRHASNKKAFHGIFFHSTDTGTRFQIRIFGGLTYLVSFPSIKVVHPWVKYTHTLNDEQETMSAGAL